MENNDHLRKKFVMMTRRRRLSNLVIDRKALARLSLPFSFMILFSVGIVVAIRWQVMDALEQTQLSGIENLPAMNALLDLQRVITSIGIVGLVLLGLLCFGMWIVYSHRIFGPTVAIRRHIRNLSLGDYASRIHLRSGDEFREMANELNRLADILAEKNVADQKSTPRRAN